LQEYIIEGLFGVELAKFPIKIKLPDGSTMDGVGNETTAYDIAKKISNSLAKKSIAAKVFLFDRKLHRSNIQEKQ
jgi:hypothetical protein